MNDLQFDPHQFAGRRHQPVDSEYTRAGWRTNGIGYEDFSRMEARNSSVPLRHKRWTPAFASSDEQLRRVILRRAWMYLHGSEQPPESLDWKALSTETTKKT